MESCIVLALMAILKLPSLSFSSVEVLMVVSLSDAVMVSVLSWMSKRKLSRMGKLFFAMMTRPMACKRADNMELEMTKIIIWAFIGLCSKRQIYSIISNQGYIFGTKLICGAFEYVLKYSCLSLIYLESLKSPTETYDCYLLAAAGRATRGRR